MAGRRLRGRGPTPPAERRQGHPAQRRAAAAEARRPGRPAPRPDAGEVVVGRNPVAEALRAGVRGSVLYVLTGVGRDPRIAEARTRAAAGGVPIREVTKGELDRLAGTAPHQGLALAVPAYAYAHPGDLLVRATEAATTPLLVALDGINDPHNLGAVVRSVAAFGGHGVVVPERRSAGVSASVWRASSGALARVPVARATNLARTLGEYAAAGLVVVGLAGDGTTPLDEFDAGVDPVVIVVGAEGRGLSRLVGERCDLTLSIPLAPGTESLNASVAVGIALYEVARRRRSASRL